MGIDVVQVTRALDYAAKKHVSQRRKGEAREPYINHLAEVAFLLAEATGGSDGNLVIAGLLHDCIEDQGVTYEELVELFGADVAELVRDVTDDKDGRAAFLCVAHESRSAFAYLPHVARRTFQGRGIDRLDGVDDEQVRS